MLDLSFILSASVHSGCHRLPHALLLKRGVALPHIAVHHLVGLVHLVEVRGSALGVSLLHCELVQLGREFRTFFLD